VQLDPSQKWQIGPRTRKKTPSIVIHFRMLPSFDLVLCIINKQTNSAKPHKYNKLHVRATHSIDAVIDLSISRYDRERENGVSHCGYVVECVPD
jgi:hypothetical protein